MLYRLSLRLSFILAPLFMYSQDAQSLVEEGKNLKKNKDCKGAIDKFREAVKLQPTMAEALYEAGWCYNELKEYDNAITYLLRARQQWSTVPKVHYELGYAFEQSAKYDSARASYYQCLSFKSDYSNIYKRLGYVEYFTDNYSTALSHFKKQIEISNSEIPDYLFWYRKGFAENALKDYNASKVSLKKSLEYETKYINTWLELGFAATKLKQDEEAIGYFEKAKEIDPNSHIPYNGIAEIYRDNKKDMNKAMEWYKKTLSVKAKERKACFGMGYCLNSQSKYSEAIPYLRTAIEEEPTYTAAYVELGYSLYKTGNNTEAKTNLNKAISLNPQNANSRFYLGLVYISEKNKSMAQQMANELKPLNSKNAELLQQRIDKM